jgi:succinate dehydrogenase/fumarate reductase flavoprotein subunit
VIAVHKRTFANKERLPFRVRWYAAQLAKVGSNIWRIIRVMERLGMDDIVCDVLVVGSGASGFATALTARHLGLDVLIAEKEPVFGGTTCFSAGVVWIPSSSAARQAQIEDSEERALCYLRQEAGNHLNKTIASAYLANAPKMLDFFTANTDVRFDLLPAMPDYHAEFAGGVGGGRSLRPRVFDGRRLGKWFEKLRPPIKTMTIFGGMMVGSEDLPHLYNVTRSPWSMLHAAKMVARHARDKLSYSRGTRLTNGNALIASLATSALEKGIPIWLSANVRQLTTEDGRVTGAILERDGRAQTIVTRRGVVLASGGFPANEDLRRPFDAKIRNGRYWHSLAPAANTGDGLRMARQIGGAFDDNVHHHVAWTPVSLVPQPDGSKIGFPHFNDRAKPGFIVVNKGGRRFANETASYHDFVPAMIGACRNLDELEAFIIGDNRAIRRYGVGAVPPAPLRLKPFVDSGYIFRSSTIRDLAHRVGIDPDGLASTIDLYNPPAREGKDPEFGRGSDAFQRVHGAPHDRGPNPNVAPIEEAPFYALRIIPGDIGTFAGLKTDEFARVLDERDEVIPNLYAVGNDMASVMRGTYPGAGITIGPAMTFGYVAARHLAGQDAG